eukprot:12920406-Prorocentrum_lima.AAC.1
MVNTFFNEQLKEGERDLANTPPGGGPSGVKQGLLDAGGEQADQRAASGSGGQDPVGASSRRRRRQHRR